MVNLFSGPVDTFCATLFLRMAAIQISCRQDGKKEQIPEQDVFTMSIITLIVLRGRDQPLMDQYLHPAEQEKADRLQQQQRQHHSNHLHKMLMRLLEIISYQVIQVCLEC